jgi:hypothetical protein
MPAPSPVIASLSWMPSAREHILDRGNRKGGLEYLGVLSRTLNRRSIRRAIQHLENRLE